MKPFGREKKLQGIDASKRDVHPRKGFMNWWEDRIAFLTRSKMKHDLKKKINDELSN